MDLQTLNSDIEFNEIRPVGSESFHADRRTWRS